MKREKPTYIVIDPNEENMVLGLLRQMAAEKLEAMHRKEFLPETAPEERREQA